MERNELVKKLLIDALDYQKKSLQQLLDSKNDSGFKKSERLAEVVLGNASKEIQKIDSLKKIVQGAKSLDFGESWNWTEENVELLKSAVSKYTESIKAGKKEVEEIIGREFSDKEINNLLFDLGVILDLFPSTEKMKKTLEKK